MLPYTAYLRVYEPLESFPEPERSRWAAYAEPPEPEPQRHATTPTTPAAPSEVPMMPTASETPATAGAEAGRAEHSESPRTLVTWPEDGHRPPSRDSQNAYVRRFSGRAYICPWKRRLPFWAAFSALQGVPMATGVATSDPHIWESSWHVPFPWFVPFIRKERRLELGTGKAATAPPRALTYVTTMDRARERLARATLAGEHAMTDVSPFGDARSLQEELSVFHPRSLVELDYGGLVHLMDDATLTADDSVGECAVALLALERGELELAVAMQLRLRGRWRAIRALQNAN